FDVRVTEPQKVGADLINAHVTYKVKTKTNCPEYRNPEFGVTRRYRDFLWLYNQLQERYPGVIIPPIPEKNALGRFQNEFVETRRLGLERCLKRITIHPLLQSDADLRMFLESETFAVDVNQKRREENKTGFMSVFTTSLTSSPVVPTATKIENDEEFFVSRRNQLDAVENQLRFLLKAVEVLIKQRRDLGATLQDFGESLAALGTIEVNKPAAQSAIALGKVQIKIKELYERQAKHDLIHIFGVVDEYVRVIGSIKLAFASRVKAFVTWQTADTNSYKKRDALNKLKASAKIRSDKISFGEAEIIELEKSTAEAKQAFHDITERLRSELIRYDQEKVADFASGIQGMLKSMIETQKEIVGLWESYFAETGQPVPSFAA
ncbi:Vps5 C terminal like-domain-containing protein, partial [Zopfochytrium polystomum]